MSGNNHARFLQHLDESVDSVWIVANMLHSLGYSVTLPASSKAANHDEWKAHADDGDLYVSQRVEVKRLSVEFTCAEDWPYGAKFIVCAKHAFDRAKPKPFAFVILSDSRSHAAAVFSSDSKSWRVERRSDRRYQGVSQDFYLSPIEAVRFFKLPKS